MSSAIILLSTPDNFRGIFQIITPTYIAVDGGASRTRIRVVSGAWFTDIATGPTSLTLTGPVAWNIIRHALTGVEEEGRLGPLEEAHFGLGLAGANDVELRAAFLAAAPNVASISLATDAYTSVLGAHGGAPGAVVAIGTGSVGCRLFPSGLSKLVGGWGFPVGDEGGGAWLGRRALAQALRVLDTEDVPPEGLTRAVLAHCGPGRDAIHTWLKGKTSTRYAELAPVVMTLASANDPAAVGLALAAGFEIDRLARILDPGQEVPLSLVGGLAEALTPYLPDELVQWVQVPNGTALDGAVLLAQGDVPPERHTT